MTGGRNFDRTAFDAFLIAPLRIGSDQSLTVFSAIARCDLDPLELAQHLSRLSKREASSTLFSVLSYLAQGAASESSVRAILDELVERLPAPDRPFQAIRPVQKAGEDNSVYRISLAACCVLAVLYAGLRLERGVDAPDAASRSTESTSQ